MNNNQTDTSIALKLKEENEQATNKTVALFLLLFIFLVPICFFIVKVDFSKTLSIVTSEVMQPLGLFLVSLELIALFSHYRGSWIKYMLMTGLSVACVVHIFIYEQFVYYLVFIPILVATRYFEKRIIVFTSIISCSMSLLTCVLNMFLDDKSELIRTLHVWCMYDIWNYEIDATMYVIFPMIVVSIFVSLYALSITARGKALIKRQIQDSTTIAAVNTELTMASEIQLSALPDKHYLTYNKSMEIYADEKTAKEVGGDFFDYFMADENTLMVLIADVSDKGVPAAMFMMSAKKTIRCIAKTTHCLKDTCNAINEFICDDNKSGMFLTLWIAAIDVKTGKGKFVNAGHTQPYIRHSDGSVEVIENEPNVFMGVFKDTEYEPNLIELNDGDSLVMYTDGVTDAMNSTGIQFGDRRLKKAIMMAPNTSEGIYRNILAQIDDFSDGTEQFDDITMLVLHCHNLEEPICRHFTLTGDNQTLESTMDEINMMLTECPDINRRNIDTVIDEVYSNAFEHALRDSDDDFDVDLIKGNNWLDITFSYISDEFNLLEHNNPNTEIVNFGGMGIYLIKNLTDKVEYDYIDNKNVIKCRFIWNI